MLPRPPRSTRTYTLFPTPSHFLSNRGLQSRYAELVLSAAYLAQASRLPNPGFSFKRLSSNGDLDIDRQFSLDAMGVLTLPIRHAIEKRRFEQEIGRAHV